MRICVIGDSHTAALKAGWKTVAGEFPDIDLTFFAARRELLLKLAVEDGALVADDKLLRRAFEASSGGGDRIDPRFDAYILCGLESGMRLLVPLMRVHRPATIAADARQALSNACYIACMTRLLALTPMMWLLGRLRQVADAPAVLVASPAAAARPVFARFNKSGEDVAVAALYARAFEGLAEPLGARVLAQPSETLAMSALTTNPIHFKRGEHLIDRDDDLGHANAAYGAIVLRRALEALGQAHASTNSG